jgi:hemoglobin
VLGPIFAARIADWQPHLERMVAFWSSVALMTGRYHGRPVPAHTPLPIGGAHFQRWLGLFRETANELCTPAGAAHVIERAERIARSLHIAVEEAQTAPDAIPALR